MDDPCPRMDQVPVLTGGIVFCRCHEGFYETSLGCLPNCPNPSHKRDFATGECIPNKGPITNRFPENTRPDPQSRKWSHISVNQSTMHFILFMKNIKRGKGTIARLEFNLFLVPPPMSYNRSWR
jgi:hypothetical protein